MDLMEIRRIMMGVIAMASGNNIDIITVAEDVVPNSDGSGTKAYLENIVSGRGDCMIVSPTYAGSTSKLYNLVFIIYKNGVFTSGANTSYEADKYQTLATSNGEVSFVQAKPRLYAGAKLYILPLD